MTNHPNIQLWSDWLALWNGDLELATKIIAPDYVLHMMPMGDGGLDRYAGPEGLAAMVGMMHAFLQPLHFTQEMEPLHDQDKIAGRWIAQGRYAGGFPGATAEKGTPITFAGADFLRIKNGKIAEYWLSSDTHALLKQLGTA